MKSLFDLIEGDKKFQVLLKLPDRWIVKVPIDCVEKDDAVFKHGRAVQPKIDVLTRAAKKAELLYYPIVWVEYTDELHIILVDGVQRFNAMENAKKPSVIVQWILGWKTKEEAFLEGTVAANNLRWHPTERDLLEIARQLGCSAAKLEDFTSQGRRTLDKICLVAMYEGLYPLVEHKVFSINSVAQFISACEGDTERIAKLEKVLLAKLEVALKGVKEAEAETAALGKNVEADKGLKQRADIKSYFRNIDLKSLKKDLEKGGDLELRTKATGKKFKSVRIGSEIEWSDRSRIAIWGLDNVELDEVATGSLELLVSNWDRAKMKLEQLLKERKQAELPPLPSTDPVHKDKPVEKPKEQDMGDVEITPRQEAGKPKRKRRKPKN